MPLALRRDVVPDRDLIFVSEPIWKFLFERYGGEEIKRYAITKNPAGVLDRNPYLPVVLVCLVLKNEAIRQPKFLVLPRKSKLGSIKMYLRE